MIIVFYHIVEHGCDCGEKKSKYKILTNLHKPRIWWTSFYSFSFQFVIESLSILLTSIKKQRSPFETDGLWTEAPSVAAWKLTQSGQDDVRWPGQADRPKDLRQEGVGAHGGHAGRGQVGAVVIVQVEELLELLHRLQRKAPFSNLDGAVEESVFNPSGNVPPPLPWLLPPNPPAIALKINIKMLKT